MLKIIIVLVLISSCSKKNSDKNKEVKQKIDKKLVIKDKTKKNTIAKNDKTIVKNDKTAIKNDKTIINNKKTVQARIIKEICTKQFFGKPEKLKACIVKLHKKKIENKAKPDSNTGDCIADENRQYKATVLNDLSCNTDDDCIYKSLIPGNCCAKCNQANAYSKKTYKKMWKKRNQCCKNVRCIRYKCGHPFKFSAKCKKYKCILIKTKR
jgi:hypothetical protein